MKLLDTSVLVEIDRGNSPEKIERLDDEGRHGISQVTVTEMFLGVEYQYQEGTEEYREAKSQLERLISRFKTFEIDRPVSTRAARIISDLREKGKPVDDLHDTYIAATALKENLELLTKNPDDFKEIEELEVRKWRDF